MQARFASPFSLVGTFLALSSPAAAQAPFDWIVPPGQVLEVETSGGVLTGGDGQITGQITIADGVIDVRNVVIPGNSEVQFVGGDPVVILASGDVTIDGVLSVSGVASTEYVQIFGPSFGGD